MRYTQDSPLSITPDPGQWTAHFRATNGEQWEAPVIGWAIVVDWTNWETHPEETDEMQTAIQPVLIDDDRFAVTLKDYLANRTDGVEVRLAPTEPPE